MKYLLVVAAILVAIGIGVAGIVYGGHDDSPGLQLISALLIIAAIVYGVRVTRRRAGDRR